MKVLNNRLVAAARRINFIWPIVARLIVPRRAAVTSQPRAILILDLHLIGDLVMLLPFLAALREKHPAARLVLVAGPWASNIIAGETMLDEYIPYTAPWVKPQPLWRAARELFALVRRLRRERWDWAIDVRGDIRQILLVALSRAPRRISYAFTGGEALLTDVVSDDGRLAHLAEHHRRMLVHLDAWPAGRSYTPRLHLSEQEMARAAAIEPFIGFHFGASIVLRRLPPQEGARLVNSFAHSAEPLLLFEPEDTREYNTELRAFLTEPVRARLQIWHGGLRDFIVVASRAKQIFAMDSGPAHIAAALGVPTVVFFGPNRPEYSAPLAPLVSVAEVKELGCRPCQNFCTNAIHQSCLLGALDTYLRESHRPPRP
jgi:ADP-heptose:LPS heptosyltransferase